MSVAVYTAEKAKEIDIHTDIPTYVSLKNKALPRAVGYRQGRKLINKVNLSRQQRQVFRTSYLPEM